MLGCAFEMGADIIGFADQIKNLSFFGHAGECVPPLKM